MKTFLSVTRSALVLVMLFSGILSAQELPQIVPPAPNAAAMVKYVDMPVSYVTGIPNISVPIYNISHGEISLPVNLSYHAGGIRVEEIASWVGLGWSLNAGGVVSRTTKGLPDDAAQDGYIYTSKTVQALSQLAHNSQQLYDDIVDSMNGGNDYEPDIFSFNFGGYSGKFAYDQGSDEFFQMPYSNVKITPVYETSGTKITSWVFTTPDGFKYYFGESEDGLRTGTDVNSSGATFSHSNNGLSIPASGPSIPIHITSWHLMDIVSPNGDQVKFYYDTQIGVTNFVKTSEDYVLSCGTGGSGGDFSASFMESTVNQSVLDKIEFGDGTITFIEDTATRTDLSGAKALKTIEISYDSSLIKKFNLTHDYSVSAVETGKWTNLGNDTQRRYRLRLLSVQEEGLNGTTLPPFSFEYSSIALPSRFSNAQDYWGYYNAKTSNISLIPETYISGIDVYTGDANRTVDTVNSKAGILTKVTYPTGGSAEYFYESNTASNIISESTGYNLRNRSTASNVSFTKIPANWNGTLYTKNFTVGANIMGQVTITSSMTGCSDPNNLAHISCDFGLSITGITDPNFSLLIGSPEILTTLPAGTYKVEATVQGSGSTDFNVLISWAEDPHPAYLNIGGQRIQKIVLNDAEGNTLEKTFEYDKLDQSLTSGNIISSPIFLDTNFWNGSCSPPQNVEKITSYSQAPSVFVKGNAMSYSNVTEFRSDNVKTEYTFNHNGDIAHSSSRQGIVHLPDLYADWIRGNLVKKEAFSLANSVYKTVKSDSTVYERVSTGTINNFGLTVLPTIGASGVTTFEYGFYSGMSEWYRPKKTYSTIHYDTDEVTTVQDLIYDNNALLPSKIITTTSDDMPLITLNYYPEDVTLVSDLGHDNLSTSEKAAIDKLKSNDLHRIAQLVQSETYKDEDKDNIPDSNELLSTQRTIFKVPYTNMVVPDTIQTAKGTKDLENRIVFESYYANGKLKEVSKADGATIVYIWGYNEQYPIAKIENASYSQISSQVSNLHSKSNADNDRTIGGTGNEGALRTALSSLQTSVPDALVTTYTYDPLVGVTSITDPTGNTIYYEYDDLNRLERVLDEDGKILSKNTYNFKNQ